jgi:DNA-binding NarL/FixJ family response regulator
VRFEISRFVELSRREREVLDAMLVHGGRVAKLGEVLFLSPNTVKVHLQHIRVKLGARTSIEAAAMWERFKNPTGASYPDGFYQG